jgi:vanillate O-demethylase ferredoxin subunit
MAAPIGDFEGLLRVVVKRARMEAIDVRRFDLAREDGTALPGFHAGAHVDVVVHLPDRSRALRPLSIASPPSDEPDNYTLAVLFEENGTGGSIFLHERVREGYKIEISPPKNYFQLAADAGHSVLVAGGIGVTPILAMAHELSAADRPFEFHYAAKSADHMAFRQEIQGAFGDRASLYFDGGDPAAGVDLPAVMGAPAADRHFYVCGPTGMIEAARDLGRRTGWPEESIHFEVFTPPQPTAGDAAVEVVAQRSGITVQVPKDTPILDALLDSGVNSDYDCRMGICGTCAVQVLEGEPAHRDNVLTDKEHARGTMCTCVSRSTTPRLVLDL